MAPFRHSCESLQWSQVAAKAAGMKVVTATRSSRDSATISMDTLFEAPEFSKQLLARKAAAIIRQALSPDSVLFSFPVMLFDHRTDAYKEIQDQIGPFASVRPLSNYDARARKDLLIAVKFRDEAHTKVAIESGITVDDVVCKASPTASGAENPLVRVQLNLLHNADDSNLKDELMKSLKYYGKVYQIRRTLCNGFFEGQITVTIDPSAGYVDEKGMRKDAQPLQRMLYLETWDVFAPASFKGAAPICYYCRQAGHIRNACPELAKRVCFGCGNRGHTKRYCREVVPNEDELLSSYVAASAEYATTEKSPAGEQPKEQDTMSKDQVEKMSTESMGNDTMSKDQAEKMSMDTEEAESDSAMETEEHDRIEITKVTTPKRVDPSESIHASKYAPYHTATTMKVDTKEEMIGMSSVKPSTKEKTDKVKRSILGKPSSMNYSTPSSLNLKPIVPKQPPQTIARRAQ